MLEAHVIGLLDELEGSVAHALAAFLVRGLAVDERARVPRQARGIR